MHERPRSSVAGVVLAGGYSRRFGEADKALATVGSRPMLARVVARVGAVTDRVLVSCRAEQRTGFADALASVDVPVAYVPDPVPDRGPLAGLCAALERAEAPVAVVVACDMPDVDPAVLGGLLARLDGHEAAVPARPDGTREPVQAVYRTRATAAAAERALSDGRRSLRAALEALDVAAVSTSSLGAARVARSLADVDTTGDLEALRVDGT